MRNIKLIIEYDGKEYKGWQKQKDRLNIQGEIEKAISTITSENIELIGSGRTDAGVSALGQVANFKTNSELPIDRFPYAINSLLKKSIRIKSAIEVDEDFHSRYTCKKKKYMYTINNSEQGTAIYRNLQFHFQNYLDEKLMNDGVQYLIGKHDFKSFKASGTSSKSSVRTIYDAKVWREGELVKIELTGNGFLYNMIRIIAGTLIDVGQKKIKPSDVKKILDAQDRNLAGKTLPACGLCLMSVEYE